VNLSPDSLAWEKSAGLLPAVVQHADTGTVLMLGYMNREALARTLASGCATFWSRSRGRLWEKGETSGNRLDVVSVHADCDGDTLLLRARPQGPVCHQGTSDCFPEAAPLPAGFIGHLAQVVAERSKADPADSYTARLIASGSRRVAQKVAEEGVEVALASAAGDRPALVEESADLLYHLLVTLQDAKVPLEDVMRCLAARRR
jgi:phosphoribosyl-ATP pyrophosphohydrolase/phosphoribosyl-AMP cyclohydrolase